jgi:VWFA-related protein
MRGPDEFAQVLPVAAWLFALCLTASPQDALPGRRTGPTSEIKATVNEVSLDIIVRDKHGRPIRDLNPGEVHIVDDGQPATVKVTGNAGSASAEPNADASRSGETVHQFHLVSLVFDLETYSIREARDAATEMVKTANGPNVYFSVWQAADGIRLLQPFTTDPVLIQHAIENATAGVERITASKRAPKQPSDPNESGAKRAAERNDAAPMNAATQALTEMTLAIQDATAEAVRQQNDRPVVSGLLALVTHQAALTGRKTVLYFSPGKQVSGATRDQLRSIVGAANRAGVSICTVDTSGVSQQAADDAAMLMAATATDAGASSTGLTIDNHSAMLHSMATSSLKNHPSKLRELADATGGTYIGDASDLHIAIHRIAEDITTYYEATYTPHIAEYDGRFREISVTVDRPKAQVQSRAGYYSLPPGDNADLAPFEAPLLQLLNNGPKAETVPFSVQVLRFGRRNGQPRAALVVDLPLGGIEHREDPTNKLFTVHVSFLALIKASDGRLLRKLSQDREVQGALEHLGQSRSETLTFERSFAVPPGNYRAEIAIADQHGNRTSAKIVDFSIDPVRDGLSMSDLAVVSHMEPLAHPASDEEPLTLGGNLVVPEPHPESKVVKDTDLQLFLAIYPDPKSSAKPQLEFQVLKDDDLVGSAPLALPHPLADGSIPLTAAIRHGSLNPGSYELVAQVTQGGVTEERKLAFVVEGPRVASGASRPLDPAAGPQTEAQSHASFLANPKLLDDARKPADAELKSIVTAVRQRGLEYQSRLPDLVCMQVTRRSVDPSGRAAWKYKDTVTRVIRYINGEEHGDVLELNGQRANWYGGLNTTGEFGGLLDMVLSDKIGTTYEWVGMTEISGVQAHVLRCHVSRKNSELTVSAHAKGPRILSAYNATVYVDVNTLAVRRVAVEAVDIPRDFPVRESVVTVDYDYASLGTTQYLLPMEATLLVRVGSHDLKRNEVRFLDYRKFGSESTVKFGQ